MSRPTTSQIIAQGDYLQPNFDPFTLTIPHLVGILSYHQIKYPTQHNKAKLVDVFNAEIKANVAQLMRQRLDRQETLASEDGIIDGTSGLPLVSANPQQQAPARRSSRILSREPSQEPIQLEPPKRRRSSATPALGRSSTRKGSSKQPILLEQSEPEDSDGDDPEPARKVGRSKKDSEAAGSSARRVSQKFGPGTEDSGWEDNNIFQSGGESSPARSPKPVPSRKSSLRKSRKSVSAPPELDSSPPRSNGHAATIHSPPQSKFAPVLPPNIGTSRFTHLSPIKKEVEDDYDIYEDNSGLADVSANISGDIIVEEEEEEEEEIQEEDQMEEDEQTVEVSRRIANGGAGPLVSRRSTGPKKSTPLWQQAVLGLVALALSGIVGQYKLESSPLGYCDTGTNSNSALVANERTRREVEGCHAQRTGDDDPDACPPLPLVPLPHPQACTPCPPHAMCTRTTVICDDGFLLSPHPLSHVPYLSAVADGLPGMGPIAFPPKCVEDPMRKRNIGVLGKGIDSMLAVERGRRLCAGVDAQSAVDGDEARLWGFELEKLKEDMKKKASPRMLENFDSLFEEAVQQLLAYGRVLRGSDSQGNMYLATEHVDMSWNCKLTVVTRNAWVEWRRSVFGTILLILSGLYGKARMAVRRAETQRVAELVQIALDTLRSQELAHHIDPVSAPQPFLPSLQLRDVILRDEHAVPRRRRLWEQVERVVEGNANVRANLEELPSGDEARVWRWIGSSAPGRRDAFDGEGQDKPRRIVA